MYSHTASGPSKNNGRIRYAFARLEAAEDVEENSPKPLPEHVTQVGLRPVNTKRPPLESKQHAADPGELGAMGVIALFSKVQLLGEWCNTAFLSGNSGNRAEVKAWASTSAQCGTATEYCCSEQKGEGNIENCFSFIWGYK